MNRFIIAYQNNERRFPWYVLRSRHLLDFIESFFLLYFIYLFVTYTLLEAWFLRQFCQYL